MAEEGLEEEEFHDCENGLEQHLPHLSVFLTNHIDVRKCCTYNHFFYCKNDNRFNKMYLCHRRQPIERLITRLSGNRIRFDSDVTLDPDNQPQRS